MTRFLIGFTMICLLAAGGMATVWLQRQQSAQFVIVVDDAEPLMIDGQFERVQDVLNAAGMWVRPVDIVSPDVLSVPDQKRPIIINRAREIDVVLPTGRSLYFTHRPTLGAFLMETGIRVRPGSTILADGLPIAFEQINGLGLPNVVMIGEDVNRAADSGRQPLSTPAPTATFPVSLPTPQPQPTIAVAYPAAYPVDSLQLIAATVDNVVVEDTAISFETSWQPTEEFEIDTTGVLVVGESGILRKEYVQNGETLTLQREYVLKPPVNQVNGYGTRLVVRTLTTAEGETYDYWRKVEMRVTSYTAATSGKERNDPWYGITASGVKAGYGVVAVDRGIVPWRSWVYVPGYGKGFVGDVGGGILGRWIDLGYDEDAFEWWSGFTDVYFLTPVPEPERINYLLPQELPPLPNYDN